VIISSDSSIEVVDRFFDELWIQIWSSWNEFRWPSSFLTAKHPPQLKDDAVQ